MVELIEKWAPPLIVVAVAVQGVAAVLDREWWWATLCAVLAVSFARTTWLTWRARR